jgi:hypothetical protein
MCGASRPGPRASERAVVPMKRLFFVACIGLSTAALAFGCGPDDPSGAGASGSSSSSGSGGEGQGGSGGAGGSGSGGGGAGQGGAGGGGSSLWKPSPGTTWQWQLSDLPLDTSLNVAMYDVDLFETTDAELQKLHADGRVVVCYFSAGSFEKGAPLGDVWVLLNGA